MIKKLALDDRGLEGLPLKLLISVMIVSLSAQPLYGAIAYLDYSQDLGLAVQQAESIRKAAVSAFIGGPGNIRKVSIHLGDQPSTFSIRLGGAEDESRTGSIDVLKDGGTAASITLGGQGIRIVGKEGNEIIIKGDQTLQLTCMAMRSGDLIIAETI